MPERTYDDAYDLLVSRVGSTLAETGAEFPYFADPETGEWTTTANGNWCGGHWIHMLWLAADHTGEERFAEAAREHTETMHDYMPREAMFCGMNFDYAGFRAYDVTGDDRERDLGIEGADAMREYYHEGARQIPLGVLEIASPTPEFRGPVDADSPPGSELGAVDALYAGASVLWRAYEETGDPHYRDVAVSHADRHLDWYVRDDGSTWHHAQFDPQTGDLVRQYNELAYSDDTCWARGVGWCVAGLALAYVETEGERYLRALENVMEYYETHAPEDVVPYWDFEHPDIPNVPRDTSCASLSAYGLTRLPSSGETAHLRELGDRIVTSLVEDYLTPQGEDDDRPAGMTLEGCYNGPSGYADHHELVWTDYYLMETLHRLTSA